MTEEDPEFGHHERNLEDILRGITTPLYINNDTAINGTGFFYFENPLSSAGEPSKKYKNIWLVTSRHVLLSDEKKAPSLKMIEFRTRRINCHKPSWNKIKINTSDLEERLKVSSDTTVDIAIIKITDKIEQYHPNLDNDFGFFAVSDKILPENINFKVESGDDVLVVGYPRGFHDMENLYPIVRSSSIASKWKANFNGFACFIIDRKHYPGSSGSLVITKPTNIIVSKGEIATSGVKQFAFLGIYSGKLNPNYHDIDTGYVWYGSLIKNIIRKENQSRDKPRKTKKKTN
jgi:hypothetical protein